LPLDPFPLDPFPFDPGVDVGGGVGGGGGAGCVTGVYVGRVTFDGTALRQVNVQPRVIVCPFVNTGNTQLLLSMGTATTTVTAVVWLVMTDGVIVTVASLIAIVFRAF
jgi:hypothetical protein